MAHSLLRLESKGYRGWLINDVIFSAWWGRLLYVSNDLSEKGNDHSFSQPQNSYVKQRAMNKPSHAASLAPNLSHDDFLGLSLKHKSSYGFFPFLDNLKHP